MKKFLVLVGTLLMIFLVSCSKYPQEKFDTLQAKIDSALIEGASVFTADQMGIIDLKFDSITFVSEVEKSKGPFKRNYNTIMSDIDNLIIETDSIRGVNNEIKNSLIPELNTLCANIDSLISIAPTGKDGKLVIEDIQSDVDELKSKINFVSQFLSESKYEEACKEYNEIKFGLMGIIEELETVINKVK